MKTSRIRMRWCVGVMMAVAVAVAAGGCKKQPASKGDPVAQGDDAAKAVPALYAHVPADTPYLFGALEAMPLDYFVRMKDALAPLLEGIAAKARKESKELDAILGELDGKWNEAGLESLGLTARPRFAMYGLGLQPFVMRSEVKDQKVLLATIERLVAKAGETLPPTKKTADGRDYWRIDTGEGAAVIALVDNHLIAALGSPAEIDAKLGLILGSEKPPQNMADGKALKELLARHKLGPAMIGYVDTQRITSAAIAAAGVTPTPTCTAAIAALTAKVPRLVFGYNELTTKRISSGLIVELSPQVTAAVRAVKTEIPGLAAALASPALVVLGGGVDLARGQEVLAAAAGDVQQLGAACELASLVEGAGEMTSALAKPIPAPFGQIAGGVVVAYELDIDLAAEQPMPKKLEAVAVLAAKDAKGLFQSLTTQAPELGQLGIAPDGKLHDLPAGTVPAPWPMAAAVGDNRVVVAIGERRTALAEPMLTASGGSAPLFAMSYDYGRFLELAMAAQPRELVEAEPEVAALMTGFVRAMSSLLGKTTTTLDVTDAGVALWSTIELK